MSDEPRTAYLLLHTGERVDCLLEREGEEWQATPVRHVAKDEVESVYVDVLPPGGTISFLLEEDEDLS